MRDNDSQKIIVVGIPQSMDDAALSELFSSFGTVADAKVVLDVNNKQPRGFGFVTFTSGAAMRAAIEGMNKKVVDGRTLNVRQLVPKDKFQAAREKDENAPDAASRPCWRLRKGKCTLGDACPFSHVTKNGEFGSCFEFMQTGECKRGAKCIFSHNISDAAAQDAAAAAADTAGDSSSSSNKPTPVSTAPATTTTATADAKKPRVCYAFQKGKCHRGRKCMFVHEKVAAMVNDQPTAVVLSKSAAARSTNAFEVVTQAAVDTTKRSRINSYDDDDDDDDDDDGSSYAKATAVAPGKTTMAPARVVKKELPPVMSVAAAATSKPPPVKREARTPAAVKTEAVAPVAVKTEAPAAVKTEAPAASKRPRDASTSDRHASKPHDKRPRFDPSSMQSDAPLHPAAKRIRERELQISGPSKYGDGQGTTTTQQQQHKPKPSAGDRFAKRAARNNKAALQRQKRKDRVGGAAPANDSKPHSEQHDAATRPTKKRSVERVDMGAAFDGVSDDDRKPRKAARVVDKATQKANREKAQLERRAKRDAKKTALNRLQTPGTVEL